MKSLFLLYLYTRNPSATIKAARITNEFWNTHFKNSLDSVFTRDYAKQLAIDLCEYDFIM